MIKPILLALSLGLGLSIFSAPTQADEKKPAENADVANYEKQMDALIGKYDAFRIAVKDDEQFRQSWLTRMRLTAVVKPKTAKTPNFVLSIGGEMLLDMINPYLRRSDDDSAIAYLGILSRIFEISVNDEQVCKIFLDSSSNISDSDNERLESILDAAFYDDMVVAMGSILRAGKTGPENVLTESESNRIVMEMLEVMMNKYGDESVANISKIDDKNTPPMAKCNAMMQMLSSISGLKKADQAGLTRTLFGGDK